MYVIELVKYPVVRMYGNIRSLHSGVAARLRSSPNRIVLYLRNPLQLQGSASRHNDSLDLIAVTRGNQIPPDRISSYSMVE